MKVMVATRRGQGIRDNDYFHGSEGELVRIDIGCATDRDNPDGRCGCGRGFAGLTSSRAMTTAIIEDRPLSHRQFVDAVGRSCARDWQMHRGDPAVRELADDLLRFASAFDIGAVLERRGDLLQVRQGVSTPQTSRR